MTRSQKLNAALEVLDFKLNKQFSSLIKLMKDKIENDKKLHDLVNYQNNYSTIQKDKKNQTITSIQLHHKLMNRLEQAIDVQQTVVIDLEDKVNQKIISLQKNRAQNKALGTLIERYRMQEIELSERNEQKELDSQILAMLHNDPLQK
ncbi:MAG: flagellar export protein FliJ [Pseudomonadota bacterium]